MEKWPLALVALSSLAFASDPVSAQSSSNRVFPCDSFKMESDRQLHVVQPRAMLTPNGTSEIKKDERFGPGDAVGGLDIYATYQMNCGGRNSQ